MESSESVHALLQQGLLEDPRGMEVETLLLTNEISSQPSEKQKASADQYTAEYAPSSDLLTEKELQVCLCRLSLHHLLLRAIMTFKVIY